MNKTAKITITNIAIDCIFGVSERERSKKQTIFVSLELDIDATKASKTDNIEDTVNYRNIYQQVISLVEKSQFHLLERLSSAILAICLEDTRILKAMVKITKPSILEKAKGVSLEMSGGNIKDEK